MTSPRFSPGPLRRDGRMIVSFPKSGRTWLRFALASYSIDATFTHAGNGTRRREIGRHFAGIPDELARMPLVFLHRNPIDTAVSLYYQVTRRDLRRGSRRYLRMYLPLLFRKALPPSDLGEFVLHPAYGIGKICAFNRAWLDHVERRDDCLILTYESMRENPAQGFQKLLDFFGETAATGEELANASSFEIMKRVETTSATPPQLRLVDPVDPNSAKVRSGKVGGYTDELRPNTIDACREIAKSFGFVA